MGDYINPREGTKEEFLAKYGKKLPEAPSWESTPEGCLPVCLVDNGYFTAAAIGTSKKELEEFQRPTDLRPKQWFYVKKELLEEFIPERRQ
jgi:hypothetical protein